MKATTSQRLRHKAANKIDSRNSNTPEIFEDRLNRSISAAKDKIERILGRMHKWEVNTESKSDRYQYLIGYIETNKCIRFIVDTTNNSVDIDSMKTV